MAAFQAVFALGNLHQLGAIAAEVERGSRYYLFSSDRLHLWMGLHYHRFIKCNFIGNWYKDTECPDPYNLEVSV
jgi:hypothetical protein